MIVTSANMTKGPISDTHIPDVPRHSTRAVLHNDQLSIRGESQWTIHLNIPLFVSRVGTLRMSHLITCVMS